MSMRLAICLIGLLVSGCQSVPVFEQPPEGSLIPIMPLWERYRQCIVTTNPEELLLVIDSLETADNARIEPPFWMRGLGHHVMSQPLRTAVDPQALGASCTLRAAALLVERARIPDALVLYQRILARYSSPDLDYYVHQAKEALKNLSGSVTAALALHSNQAVSR